MLARPMTAASAGLTKTWLVRGTISSALLLLRGLAATPARPPLRKVRIPKLGPALTVRPAHLATTPEREPGFHFDRLSGDRVRLECPLAKRVLNGLALRFWRTDHVHVLNGSVAIDDDAHRDRHWRGAQLRRFDLVHHLLVSRVVPDADGSSALADGGKTVKALHQSLPLIRAARRQCHADQMAADFRDNNGAVEPDAAEVDAPGRTVADRHLGRLAIDAHAVDLRDGFAKISCRCCQVPLRPGKEHVLRRDQDRPGGRGLRNEV